MLSKFIGNPAVTTTDEILMQDKQDLIIQHNFTYRRLPKVILDKFQEIPDKKGGGKGDKQKDQVLGKNESKQDHNKIKSMKDVIMNHDPSHLCWCIKDGENFTKIVYSNGKKCPKILKAS